MRATLDDGRTLTLTRDGHNAYGQARWTGEVRRPYGPEPGAPAIVTEVTVTGPAYGGDTDAARMAARALGAEMADVERPAGGDPAGRRSRHG